MTKRVINERSEAASTRQLYDRLVRQRGFGRLRAEQSIARLDEVDGAMNQLSGSADPRDRAVSDDFIAPLCPPLRARPR
jgi:hypothetical protein